MSGSSHPQPSITGESPSLKRAGSLGHWVTELLGHWRHGGRLHLTQAGSRPRQGYSYRYPQLASQSLLLRPSLSAKPRVHTCRQSTANGTIDDAVTSTDGHGWASPERLCPFPHRRSSAFLLFSMTRRRCASHRPLYRSITADSPSRPNAVLQLNLQLTPSSRVFGLDTWRLCEPVTLLNRMRRLTYLANSSERLETVVGIVIR